MLDFLVVTLLFLLHVVKYELDETLAVEMTVAWHFRNIAGCLHLHQYPRILAVRTIDCLIYFLSSIDRIGVTIKCMSKEIVNPGLIVFFILFVIQFR